MSWEKDTLCSSLKGVLPNKNQAKGMASRWKRKSKDNEKIKKNRN
jgi:hypothetical protein